MKLDTVFSPVTITFETQEEWDVFRNILHSYIKSQDGPFRKSACKTVSQAYNLLEFCSHKQFKGTFV